MGSGFIPHEFIPEGKDEYYLREEQANADQEKRSYRKLQEKEIAILEQQGNRADDWANVQVEVGFNASLVQRCSFFGKVRIGKLEELCFEFNDLRAPVGLYDSTIVSCDLGANVSIRNVGYLAFYRLEEEVILFNVEEMQTTNYAKFGNGVLKEGEDEKTRIWLELGNENGGRKVLPFEGMRAADAWMWSKYRDDEPLLSRFREMTERVVDNRRGYYGSVGRNTMIKNCRILKDVIVGEFAYLKGANKLKNLTICSEEQSQTQIGEGVELVNGIIHPGARVFYGVKAIRFVLGRNSSLKYGARLINSLLGENSTISCCEVLNSLLFPNHEQHHNNSFLTASTILGQSNIAAGATIGSNHNTRANDGELVAGRGFWPALCVNLKHNSRFASYTLLAKGSYPSEMNISLPFSLVSNDESENRLRVMPAYWFKYNMYALLRNVWKFKNRDTRKVKEQLFDFDYLAPDTIEEIFSAMRLLERWTAQAYWKNLGREKQHQSDNELILFGKSLLENSPRKVAELHVLAEGMENSNREVHVLKPHEAYTMYEDMVNYYCVRTLTNYMLENDIVSLEGLKTVLTGSKKKAWVNAGGQMMPLERLEQLKDKIRSGKISDWREVHSEYRHIYDHRERDTAEHAFSALLFINHISEHELDVRHWLSFIEQAEETLTRVEGQVRAERLKDYDNPFRKMVYETPEEMNAVLGGLEKDEFVQVAKDRVAYVRQQLERIRGFEQRSQSA